ncbi:MAG: hypothetical protein ACSHYB_17860 [Roseibacillus sp.]
MKKFLYFITCLLLTFNSSLWADIVVPGADGSDCDLTITVDTEIDLSLAATAPWNASYATLAAADPDRAAADYIAKGVYDPEKWAVVFRYTDVSIAAGATVTFKNHPSRAPVVWLVSGDVDIAGTVSLDGENAADVVVTRPMRQAEPGPGGFRGGLSTHDVSSPVFQTLNQGSGFGPGGGNIGDGPGAKKGHGGNYFTASSQTSEGPRPILYGNPSLLPLIGGSGGAGDGERIFGDVGGGGGGGAILVACKNCISLSGIIRANGGPGFGSGDRETGGGSGGGVRVVCNEFNGDGAIQTAGGGEGWSTGGLGRIRIERVLVDNTLNFSPTPSSAVLLDDDEALVWLPNIAPSAELISLEGVMAPSDPRAGVDGESFGPDFIAGNSPTAEAVIETTNLPQDGTVQIRVNRRTNGDYQTVQATFHSQISADPLVLRWVADVPITDGYSAIQVRIATPSSNP